jgi:uncharacterized membrane protein YkoI
MKNHLITTFGLILALGFGLSQSFAAEKDEAAPATGSIRIAGKVAKADRPAMAKVSFGDALQIAEKTLAGKVLSGVLEVEDGNLQYAFEIVGADKKVGEVEIDAGNGRVLGIDHDDKD